MAVAHEQDGRSFDPGTRLIMGELRDLRLEMRADRRQAAAERRRSDERFEQLIREFKQDSARREAATQKAFKEIRVVGLSIVKTLNRHTRILEHNTQILERMDRKLGVRGNGRPGQENGRSV